MENKAVAPTGNNQALDEQRALMNKALERLGLVRRETSKAKTDARAGRLIVALDSDRLPRGKPEAGAKGYGGDVHCD